MRRSFARQKTGAGGGLRWVFASALVRTIWLLFRTVTRCRCFVWRVCRRRQTYVGMVGRSKHGSDGGGSFQPISAADADGGQLVAGQTTARVTRPQPPGCCGSLFAIVLAGAGFMTDAYDLFVINTVVVIVNKLYSTSVHQESIVATAALLGRCVAVYVAAYVAVYVAVCVAVYVAVYVAVAVCGRVCGHVCAWSCHCNSHAGVFGSQRGWPGMYWLVAGEVVVCLA